MSHAGRGVGRLLMEDLRELRPDLVKAGLRILVLAGKGHNTGDAFLAATELAERLGGADVYLYYAKEARELRSLAKRALQELERVSRVKVLHERTLSGFFADITIDGVLGMQFEPPLKEDLTQLFDRINAEPNLGLRVAIDLPSGLGDDHALRADLTYATGILKAPLIGAANGRWIGRLRYVDIGFFEGKRPDSREISADLVTTLALQRLRVPRPSQCDKRNFGHLFVLAGHRTMPGALLMSVRAALRSGVGLVTAFAPESIAPALAAAAPEAMWVPWPETPDGGLALEGRYLIEQKWLRATALLIGPGTGGEEETTQLFADLIESCRGAVMLDADALVPASAEAVAARGQNAPPVVMTPHLGEFARLAGVPFEQVNNETMQRFCQKVGNGVTVLKGPVTLISDGQRLACSIEGSPVLARGGSGDVLSGLIGGLLAEDSSDAFRAACEAVCWQGVASQQLARRLGHRVATTGDLIDALPEALRS